MRRTPEYAARSIIHFVPPSRMTGGSSSGQPPLAVASTRGGAVPADSFSNPLAVHLDVAFLAALLERCCWVYRHTTSDFNGAVETSAASIDVEKYLQGVVWTMEMYMQGECPDYRSGLRDTVA